MLATLIAENHPEFGTLVAIPVANQWGSQPAGHAYEAIGRALTRKADVRTDVATKRTGVTYVDDRVQFGPRPLLEVEIEAFSADARGVLKKILSTAFDTIGWRFNTIEGTVAPSPPSFSEADLRFLCSDPPVHQGGIIAWEYRMASEFGHCRCRTFMVAPRRPFFRSFREEHRRS